MKAISIRQPWAWLIVNGYKDIENRGWRTKIRGRVLIHAAKTIDTKAIETLERTRHLLPDEFETGGIVGAVEIVDVVGYHPSIWFEGPKGFVLKNPEVLKFIPCKGQLGIFDAGVTSFSSGLWLM